MILGSDRLAALPGVGVSVTPPPVDPPPVGGGTVDWLGLLGFIGTLEDKQYAFLVNRYVTTVGALPFPMSSSDLQLRLTGRVRDVLIQAEYP